ncbi:MAG: DNA/RNA nuclease SfsA [Myxococcales bacterium]|nr:DNA/RNA nuclease SfsA [Myxococcales bacterium]
MRFDPELTPARFLRRYKRFFLDAELESGERVVAHCPNTGSLRGCLVEGAPVMLQPASDPSRKLAWTWKMIRIDGCWVGVDTGLANGLVADAIEAGLISELSGYRRVFREVKYGVEGRSRIDLLLSRGGTLEPQPGRRRGARQLPEGDERVYVEVKNTTLAFGERGARVAAFPDAVTERGRKHLMELVDVVKQGQRAAMVFSVQRGDCHAFTTADSIDPAYGEAFRAALEAGVEAYALAARIGPRELRLSERLPLIEL